MTGLARRVAPRGRVAHLVPTRPAGPFTTADQVDPATLCGKPAGDRAASEHYPLCGWCTQQALAMTLAATPKETTE